MEMEETEKQEILRVAAQDGTVVKYYLDKDGTLQRDDTNIEGVTVTQDSAPGKFQVDLSNIKMRRLIFKNKTFEVSLSGNVCLESAIEGNAAPLVVTDKANVEINGSGEMQIRSNASTGILIDPSSSLATNLNINIAATRGYTDEAGSVGVILVPGIFQIKNGKVSVSGNSNYGLLNGNKVTIDTGACLELLDSAGMYNDSRSIIENNGTLTVNGHSYMRSSATIVNNGKWIQNEYVQKISQDATTNAGIKVGPNGTIEGSGSIDTKLQPDAGFTSTAATQTITWIYETDLSQFFTNPRGQTVTYALNGDYDSSISRIEGNILYIQEEGGAGKDYSITATAQGGFWLEKSVTITLTVRGKALEGVTIIPYEGTYDGEPHPMVEIRGVSSQAKIEYKVCRFTGYDSSGAKLYQGDWITECPKVTNVSEAPPEDSDDIYKGERLYIHINDGGKEYRTQEEDQITIDDTKYFKAKIHPRKLSASDIEVTAESPVYDPNVSGGKDDIKSFITVKYKGQRLDDKFWKVSKITHLESNGTNKNRYGDGGNYTVTLNAPAEYYPIKISVQTKPNNFIGDRDITFTIQKEKIHPIVYNHEEVNKKVYDGTTANPIDGLEILYKVHNAEDGTYSTEVPSFKEIGTHTVDYKVTSTNYEDLTGTFDVQIQKMNLADAYVGFKDSSSVYTGSALDPGVTVKGSETSEDIVSGENYTVKYQRVQDVSGNTVTEEAVTAPTEAGTYNVIITAKQESTFVEGAKTVEKGVTVLPKALSDTQGKPTVSISMTPESFTYDTKVHQVKNENIVVTDTDRNVTLTQGTDYEITPPSDPIQTAKAYIFSFTGKGNYTGSCTKEIEVKKADLTNATVEINGTYTYSGEAQEPGKEDPTAVQVTLDHIPVNSSEYTLEYANNTVAAEANNNTAPTVTVKAIADGNYQGTVSKAFTILRKPLTVTAENKKVTYKEDAPEFTAVYGGFVGEETLAGVGGTISFLCEYKNGSPAGDYEIQPEVASLANYEVTANKGTLSVQPRTPEFVDSKNLYTTRVYDGKAVDLAPTTDGDGEMSSVITNRETNEVLTSDPVDVGKYHVVYSFDAGTNYSAGSVAYDFEITSAPLKITAADQKLSYLDEIPEYTADYDGFVNGENLESAGGTVHFDCSYQKGTAVGSYPINPEVTGLKNYEVTTESGTMTVEKRTPVFTDSANLYTARVYDGKAVDLTPATDGDGTVSRVITNRETNEVLTSDPVDVGEYRVVYRVSEGKNYTEGSVSYDFAITQAPLVITAEDKNVVFGAKAPEYTVVYDGLVNGETEAVLTGTLVVTCDYTVESRESAYEIVPSGLSAKNYAITWKNGVLTVRYPESDNDDYEETSKPANSKMPESGTNNPAQGATEKDAKKGYVNENSGIVSGKTLTEEMLKNDNGSLNDGYSHWIQTNAGWWFRYADGSYPKAAGAVNSGSGNSSAAQSYEWIQIDGNWWSFDSNGYLGTGWIVDPVYGNWFYVDANTGMKTGWVQIDGKWYYFNPVSDGTKGIMFANRMTPDGWLVREDGSWDEKR